MRTAKEKLKNQIYQSKTLTKEEIGDYKAVDYFGKVYEVGDRKLMVILFNGYVSDGERWELQIISDKSIDTLMSEYYQKESDVNYDNNVPYMIKNGVELIDG